MHGEAIYPMTITLTDKQAGALNTLFTEIRWVLDPNLQLSIQSKVVARRLLTDERLVCILGQTEELNRQIIHPWLAASNAATQDKSRRWHQHLDKCAQCRERPFDLCPAGDKILTSP